MMEKEQDNFQSLIQFIDFYQKKLRIGSANNDKHLHEEDMAITLEELNQNNNSSDITFDFDLFCKHKAFNNDPKIKRVREQQVFIKVKPMVKVEKASTKSMAPKPYMRAKPSMFGEPVGRKVEKPLDKKDMQV